MTMNNLCIELNKKMEEMTMDKKCGNKGAALGNIFNVREETGVEEDDSKNKFHQVTKRTNKRTAEISLEKEGGTKRTAFGDITNTRVWEGQGAPAGARKHVTEMEKITQALKNTRIRKQR